MIDLMATKISLSMAQRKLKRKLEFSLGYQLHCSVVKLHNELEIFSYGFFSDEPVIVFRRNVFYAAQDEKKVKKKCIFDCGQHSW